MNTLVVLSVLFVLFSNLGLPSLYLRLPAKYFGFTQSNLEINMNKPILVPMNADKREVWSCVTANKMILREHERRITIPITKTRIKQSYYEENRNYVIHANFSYFQNHKGCAADKIYTFCKLFERSVGLYKPANYHRRMLGNVFQSEELSGYGIHSDISNIIADYAWSCTLQSFLHSVKKDLDCNKQIKPANNIADPRFDIYIPATLVICQHTTVGQWKHYMKIYSQLKVLVLNSKKDFRKLCSIDRFNSESQKKSGLKEKYKSIMHAIKDGVIDEFDVVILNINQIFELYGINTIGGQYTVDYDNYVWNRIVIDDMTSLGKWMPYLKARFVWGVRSKCLVHIGIAPKPIEALSKVVEKITEKFKNSTKKCLIREAFQVKNAVYYNFPYANEEKIVLPDSLSYALSQMLMEPSELSEVRRNINNAQYSDACYKLQPCPLDYQNSMRAYVDPDISIWQRESKQQINTYVQYTLAADCFQIYKDNILLPLFCKKAFRFMQASSCLISENCANGILFALHQFLDALYFCRKVETLVETNKMCVLCRTFANPTVNSKQLICTECQKHTRLPRFNTSNFYIVYKTIHKHLKTDLIEMQQKNTCSSVVYEFLNFPTERYQFTSLCPNLPILSDIDDKLEKVTQSLFNQKSLQHTVIYVPNGCVNGWCTAIQNEFGKTGDKFPICKILKGNSNVITALLNNFRAGKIPIIILSEQDYAVGVDIESVQNIYVLDKLSDVKLEELLIKVHGHYLENTPNLKIILHQNETKMDQKEEQRYQFKRGWWE